MPYGQRGPQPPGPAPAPMGPPRPGPHSADPSHHTGSAPTQYAAAYNPFEEQPAAPTTDFAAPTALPWFRRRSVLIAWFGLIAVMLGLVIWGIVQLTSRGPGGTTTPQTTSSSSTTSSATSTTGSATTTPSSAPTAPPAPPRQAPPQQPPAQQAPPPEEPPNRYRPRLPALPSVITIPPVPKLPDLPTVITLPPHR
ncbi:hypothetical protein AWC09_16000 [Mycolicibacter hiberniae]|nr:hypothetical protein AWC09_16000 [Mycolicibacter hiberniae]